MVRTVHKVSSRRVSFCENVERHLDEVRAAGGTPEDIAALEALAEEVESAETLERRFEIDLARALSPYQASTGWQIAPPTNAARYWARIAVLAVTGGKLPASLVGEAMALAAGLLVLRLWGEGEKGLAARLAGTPGELAERLAVEMDAAAAANPDDLAQDWLALMGIQPRKKAEALGALLEAAGATLRRLQATSPSSNPSPLAPPAWA